MIRSFTATPIALVILAAAGAGCAQTIPFGSPSGLGDGVNSKTWFRPAFADSPLYNPGQLQYLNTVNFFDAVVSGTTIQIAATLRDTGTGHFFGYNRMYSDPGAWGQLGTGFGPVGSFPGQDAANVAIAVGPGGLLLETLFNGTAAGNVITAQSFGSSWTAVANGSSTQPITETSSGALYGKQPDVATVADSLGRVYSFWVDTTSQLQEGLWQPAYQVPGNGMVVTAVAGAAGVAPRITARWDGTRFVCVTYETGALKVSCADTTQTTITFNLTSSIDPASGGSTVLQHDSATDGAGGLMVVYYKKVSGVMQTYASLGTYTATGPVWSAPVQIDAGLGTGIVAPDTTALATSGAAPGIAYLGNGNYVAVWEEMTTTLAQGSNWTQLYSAVYYAGQGWSAPQAIASTLDYYFSTPHPRSMHVFSNGNNNAGFALNTIFNQTCGHALLGTGYPCQYAENQYFSQPWCYPASATIPVCNPPMPIAGSYNSNHVLWVSRFQINDGWLTAYSPNDQWQTHCQALNVTNPAAPTTTAPGGAAILQPYCTVRPKGAILPSGDTVVLFQAQDNDGNFRLGELEFR